MSRPPFHAGEGLRSAMVAGGLIVGALLIALLLPSQCLLSAPGTDLIGNFVASRAFAAQTLASGHLPLWNPYTYGGQPFLGGFESAVLYPPNLLFLCMPLVLALNFSILLHLVILGWGMERWAASRGLRPWAGVLAGFVLPLSGAVFPHVYAGHLSNLCTMAWAPWIFMGLETWIGQDNRRGLLLASAAICLQILAGHIQYFFYTAVAAGTQALVISVAVWTARSRAFPTVVGCYLAALALGAAQLLTGLAASTEGIRQHKLEHDFAAMFSFPPENFLTLLAPGFFGSLEAPVYWGRCYLWEMSLFVGTAGLLLIAIAFSGLGRKRRGAMLDLIVAGILLVLALGVHTPLFELLYQYAPGFGNFRGWSKFIFPATLFLVMIMATGADVLLRREKLPKAFAWGSLAVGLITGGAGFIYLFNPEGIGGFLYFISKTHESYLSPDAFTQATFMHEAGVHAGLSLGLAGLVLIAAGVILLYLPKKPILRWALPVLVAVEMIGFAAGQITCSDYSDAVSDGVRQFVTAHPGDYRVLDVAHPNNGFLLGAGDLGGNNPSLLKRYAEFINFSQKEDPNHVSQYLDFNSIPPIYAMLRFQYAFIPIQEGGTRFVESPTPPFPRFMLVSNDNVISGRDAIFAALQEETFDPRKTAILESEPDPQPSPDATGTVKLDSELPDELIIKADTDKPTLLVIGDLYDSNWRAEALPDSSQQSYHLMPADYILRAVPLAAGHHHLRIVYAPASFSLGVLISLVAWLFWIGLFAWDWRRETK